MASRVENPRPPLGRRPTATAPAPPRRRPAPPPSRPRPDPGPPEVPDREPGPLRDHGLTLLTVFTLAMLVMVGLAALTAIVGEWWILVPVMTVDLAVTAAVLASLVGLLNSGDSQ
jgi:hypothetical protein